MSKFKLACWLFACFLVLHSPCLAEVDAQAAAETPRKFFQAVNAKDYGGAWNLLTEDSKSRITTMVADDAKLPATDIRQMFDANDARLQAGFWDSLRGGGLVQQSLALQYQYTGEKDGALIVSAAAPSGPVEMIVKDEGGYKFGLAETYKF
jgi:hypothetical protein